jgi:hypothetical protein
MGGLRRLKTDVMLGIYERWAGRDLNLPRRGDVTRKSPLFLDGIVGALRQKNWCVISIYVSSFHLSY